MAWTDRLKQNIDEYKPIPFWSWNSKLEPELLKNQIADMKESGMGGFFIHARSGLVTEYMGDEWFDAVRVCMDEAQKQGMQAWVYDENGWPSGFAGTKLLKDPANLVHYITLKKNSSFDKNALANYILKENKLLRIWDNDKKHKEYYAVYDCINDSFVDILNPEVVKKFIEITHEKYYEIYKEDFGNRLIGFFTDEPQFYRYDTPYSPVVASLYNEIYGEDILDNLAALFLDCDDCRKFRWRYWKLLNDQFINSFAKQVYDWCESHNCKLTGHAIEECALHAQMWCCAGVMPFYEYEHIPGCDWLGRQIDTEITPKQVSSAAQQLGKKQVLTESFACTGWDVTPIELKRIIDWQFVNGVNLLCTHLTPYSLEGSRKYDHPAFFSKVNPWFEKFNVFSDYAAKLGCMLCESEEEVEVGIIHPIHSAYLTYNRCTDYDSVEKLNNDFRELVEKFGMANIPHHYIDETLLAKHGSVEGCQLRVGECRYKYIVIPAVQQLDSTTVMFLKEYFEKGGKLYLYSDVPEYQDGERADLSFLESNVDFNEMKLPLYFTNDTDTAVRSTYRKSENGDFLYVANIDDEKTQKITYYVTAKGAALIDILTNTVKPVSYKKCGDKIEIELTLKPCESKVLIFGNYDSIEKQENRANVTFSEPVMTESTLNTLVVDSVEISFDGNDYSDPMPVACACEYLLSLRKNGEIYLNYKFNAECIPQKLILEVEKMNIVCMSINGKEISLCENGILDEHFLSGNILPFVKLGENTLSLKINYFQDPYVYRVLYEMENAPESILNCLTYNTEIDAIRLYGDFSVRSADLSMGEDGVYIAAAPFTLSEHKKADMADTVGSGYPFFSGRMSFALKAKVSEITDVKLNLKGRFHAAHIKWNEYEADVVLQNDIVIPKAYVMNENNVTVTIYNGNRNILGPFHCADINEPKIVFPEVFTLKGTWNENHTSEHYRNSFSFVSFGITLEANKWE